MAGLSAYFNLDRGWLGGTDIVALDQAGGVIEGAAGMLRAQMTFALGDGVDSMQVPVLATSPKLFALLGVSPDKGRGFLPHEVGPGRPAVIVLTHELWERLGGNESIIRVPTSD